MKWHNSKVRISLRMQAVMTRIIRRTLLSLVLTPQSGLSFTPSTYTLARRCITIHTRISPRRKNHNKFATKPSSGAVISTGSTKDDIISSSGIRISSRIHEVGEIPPCPKSLESRLEDSVDSVSAKNISL